MLLASLGTRQEEAIEERAATISIKLLVYFFLLDCSCYFWIESVFFFPKHFDTAKSSLASADPLPNLSALARLGQVNTKMYVVW